MTATITRQSPADTARSADTLLFTRALEKGLTVEQMLEREDPSNQYAPDPDGYRSSAFERVLAAAGIRVSPDPEIGEPASTWEQVSKNRNQRALLYEWCAVVWRQATNPQRYLSRNLQQPIAEALEAEGMGHLAEQRERQIEQQQRAILLSGDVPIGGLARPWVDDATIRAPTWQAPIPVQEMVARTTAIRGRDLRTLYIVDSINTDAYRMKRVNEGAEIPATWIVSGEHYLQIQKYGRAIKATYETLRNQTLDRIAFLVSRIALQAEVDKAADALTVIISGDGNANTAATALTQTGLAGGSAGTLTLPAWQLFKLRFWPYAMTTVLGQEASIQQLINLAVMTTNVAAANVPANAFGTLTPVGSAAVLADGVRYGVTSDAPTLKLVGFDRRSAIERVTEIGGDVSETDRFISNQTAMVTFTESEGYGVVDPNSSKTLNINA
jgi:hypothetical protein